MDKISDRAFHVMCDMWGVDDAVKALKRMGMTVTTEQITEERKKETALQEEWKRAFK